MLLLLLLVMWAVLVVFCDVALVFLLSLFLLSVFLLLLLQLFLLEEFEGHSRGLRFHCLFISLMMLAAICATQYCIFWDRISVQQRPALFISPSVAVIMTLLHCTVMNSSNHVSSGVPGAVLGFGVDSTPRAICAGHQSFQCF